MVNLRKRLKDYPSVISWEEEIICTFFIFSFVIRNKFQFTNEKMLKLFRGNGRFCHSNCGYIVMEMQKACTHSALWRRWVSCEELGALLFCWQGSSCYGSGYRELWPAHIVYLLPLLDSIPPDTIQQSIHQMNSSCSDCLHIRLLSDQDLALHGGHLQKGNVLVILTSGQQLHYKLQTTPLIFWIHALDM